LEDMFGQVDCSDLKQKTTEKPNNNF